MADPTPDLYRFHRDDSLLLGYPTAQLGVAITMSRRVKRPLAKRPPGDRPKGARPYRGSQAERPQGHRPGGKPPARFASSAPRAVRPPPFVAEPEKIVV